MAKKEKLLLKIKAAKLADFDDIDQLLRLLGFDCRNESSHYTYVKRHMSLGL